MKIYVTGSKGRIGSYLVNRLGYEPLYSDIRDKDELFYEITRYSPDVIVNCAAVTDVDSKDVEKVAMTNYHSVVSLAHLCSKLDIKLVQLSTSFVFTGDELFPYEEDSQDFVNGDKYPPYARYKSLAERWLWRHSYNDNFLIVRLVSPYGDGRKNDPFTYIYNKLTSDEFPSFFISYFRNFTYIPHFAEGLNYAINRGICGILHIASSDITNHYGFAEMINEICGLGNVIVPDYDSSLKRPLNASLNVAKAIGLGVPIYSIEQGIKQLIRDTL